MSDGTAIDWTDTSWNPWRGCLPISPGCANCWAPAQGARQCGEGGAYEGIVSTGRQRGDKGPPKWTGASRMVEHLLPLPLKLRKGRQIFVEGMGDPFFEPIPDVQIAAVFGIMSLASWHTFQLLTKRLARAREWFAWLQEESGGQPVRFCRRWARELAPRGSIGPREHDPLGLWPLPNVWLVASVEDQQRARERLPVLRGLPAALRGVSAEPLLEPLDLRPWLSWLDWVIVGGESGPRARHCSLAWIRRLLAQCDEFKVPTFLKQLGQRVPELGGLQVVKADEPREDQKRHVPARWPAEFNIPGRRAFPRRVLAEASA